MSNVEVINFNEIVIEPVYNTVTVSVLGDEPINVVVETPQISVVLNTAFIPSIVFDVIDGGEW